ncbi:hypothetical protein PAMP_019505 [Pampus punctatissimus]
MKPAHRTESSSPQMTSSSSSSYSSCSISSSFYSSFLAPVPLHLLFSLSLLFPQEFPLLSLSSVSLIVPLFSPSLLASPTLLFLCHTGEWYSVVSLVALTPSQLDQTTWTTHILSSFMSLPWIN